jgi:hypothetical protein
MLLDQGNEPGLNFSEEIGGFVALRHLSLNGFDQVLVGDGLPVGADLCDFLQVEISS